MTLPAPTLRRGASSNDVHSSNWAGRRVVVAGSSGGIGTHVADQLAHAGATVFPFDLATGLDLADRSAVDRAVLPLNSLDAVFYLAGKAVSGHICANDAVDKLDTVVDANVRGVINLAAATAPLLRASRGRFVCANSVFSLVTAQGFGTYSASKAALSAVLASLRPELRPATITDCIIGGVRTDIFATAAVLDGTLAAWEVNDRFLRSIARQDPAAAARDIIIAAERRRRRPSIGRDAQLARAALRAAPRLTQACIYTLIDKYGDTT